MQTYPVEIPAGWADQLVDRLELRFRNVDASRQFAASQPRIGNWASTTMACRLLCAALGWMWVVLVRSLSGANRWQPASVVTIWWRSLNKGHVLESVVFDTFGNCAQEPPDESAGQALAAWLAKWPPQTLIAGAASDEASCRLSQGRSMRCIALACRVICAATFAGAMHLLAR